MKIGILTYHAAYNFGANLQALSTFSYLKKTGHEPILIDFSPKLLEEAFDKTVPVEQANSHKSFLEKHFILTKRCKNAIDIAKQIAINNIEAVIIGSDAVVQHYPILARVRVIPSRKRILIFRIDPIRYETNFPNPFWGEFINILDPKVKVGMMSVSCQNTDYFLIRFKTRRLIYKMIKNISYLSVRDKRTQNLFKHISKSSLKPTITPDPVFAFNANFDKLPTMDDIKKKYNLTSKYILLSFNSKKTVNKQWLSSFEKIANASGFQCIALAMPGGINFEHALAKTIDIPIDPIEWYSLIKFSSAYIGEKMHPIIVSLHNSVPFFSFDHYGILRFKLFLNQKASKIYHILEKADLSDYRVSILKRINYTPPIPEYVFEKIISFDKNKCSLFANR